MLKTCNLSAARKIDVQLDRFIVLSLRDWGEKTPGAYHAPFGLGPHSATIRTASVVAGMVVAGQSQGKLAS